MPTITVGTAFRIDDTLFSGGDTIPGGTSLTEVAFRTEDPDDNDFNILPGFILFEGTSREVVVREPEPVSLFANGELIATQSPDVFNRVLLQTNVGEVFGITFVADGDTYFLPDNRFAASGLETIIGASTIGTGESGFRTLDHGLVPEGTSAFEGRVFGSGAIDAPGLGLTRLVFDDDDAPLTGGTEVSGPNAEVLVSVEFDDGVVLNSVSAVQFGSITFVGAQNVDARAFAVDVAAIEATGRTLDNIVDADFQSFADNDLTFADLGFEVVDRNATAPAPEPDPEPEPAPDPEPELTLNIIEGTRSNDRLIGTDGDDALIGGGDNDRLTGGEGADVFIFGSNDRDRDRDRDVITDFNAGEDTIVLEDAAQIRNVFERNDDVFIRLEGDRDLIVVRDNDLSIVDDVIFVDDIFLV